MNVDLHILNMTVVPKENVFGLIRQDCWNISCKKGLGIIVLDYF